MATPPVAEPVARIRGLNDAFRRGFTGGRVVLTVGVAALPPETWAVVLAAVRSFEPFIPGSGGAQNALAQQIESGAAIHALLDQLEAVDLPLDQTVAPQLGDGHAHGRLVHARPGDEAAEARRGRSLQPWRAVNATAPSWPVTSRPAPAVLRRYEEVR